MREGEGERDLRRLRPTRAREGKGRLGRDSCSARAPGRPTTASPAACTPLLFAAGPRGRLAHRLGRLLPPVRLAARSSARRPSRCTSPTGAASSRTRRRARADGRRRALGDASATAAAARASRRRSCSTAICRSSRRATSTRAASRYRQESFAAHIRETRSLVSFVATHRRRDVVDRLRAAQASRRRRAASRSSEDGTLERGDNTYLFVSDGAPVRRLLRDVRHRARDDRDGLRRRGSSSPARARASISTRTATPRARDKPRRVLGAKLAEAATYEVPERVVQDAQRSLLIQSLSLGWRYSVGDRYHSKLFDPGGDRRGGGDGRVRVPGARPRDARRLVVAQARLDRELAGSARSCSARRATTRSSTTAPTSTSTRRRPRDVRHAPAPAALASKRRLLRRERYSADVYANVYGLHSQAVAWQGLRAMASVWDRDGPSRRSRRARARVAARLGARSPPRGAAVVAKDAATARSSSRSASSTASGRTATSRLAPGQLLEPRDAVRARVGNLPAARHARRRASSATCSRTARASSGSSAPARTRSTGRRGSPKSGNRPGLRAQPRALPRRQRPARPARAQPLRPARGGHDARDVRLRRGGDASRRSAASYYRTMFLPPNSASNSAFLETLRLMLVHETRGPERQRRAASSSRSRRRAAGCSPGKQIAVDDAPTSFGRLSYSLSANDGRVDACGRRSELAARCRR